MKKIALVVSEFNTDITELLLSRAIKRCHELGWGEDTYQVFRVPGAVEIPWRCQQCVHEGFAAVVALGAVIRGETGHYEVVCQQVAYGCQKVMLEHHLPIGFGVLTTENHQQALRRANGEKHDAGAAAVDAVFSLLQSAAPVSV